MIPILGCLLFLVGVGKLWHIAKDGFSLARALFPALEEKPYHFPCPSSAEVQQIAQHLAQPYTYLGRGHQCYAFESADGRYVLKLLRQDRYHLSLFRRCLALPFCTTRAAMHQDLSNRFSCLMKSLEIAIHDLAKETGLLYLHFGSNRSIPLPPLHLIDALGRTYMLKSQSIHFILQEKKELLLPHLQNALYSHNDEEAKRCLDLWIQFVVIRAKKGIFNKDPSFVRNFGIDTERVVQIDTGSFYRTQTAMTPESFQASIYQTMGPVQEWLKTVDPCLASYLESQLQQIQTDKL